MTDLPADHAHEPQAGTMRDWAGWHRLEELAFDYPMNATCCYCQHGITKLAPGAMWVHGASPEATDEPAERVTVQYDLPGTHPVLTVGISDRARVLIGERIGDSRDPNAGVNWITRLGDDGTVDGLQQVLEQVRADQARIARQVHPSQLRRDLRTMLLNCGMATLTEIESTFIPGTHRNDLIAELARMRDDGEVEFAGPRYRLTEKTGLA